MNPNPVNYVYRRVNVETGFRVTVAKLTQILARFWVEVTSLTVTILDFLVMASQSCHSSPQSTDCRGREARTLGRRVAFRRAAGWRVVCGQQPLDRPQDYIKSIWLWYVQRWSLGSGATSQTTAQSLSKCFFFFPHWQLEFELVEQEPTSLFVLCSQNMHFSFI